MPVRNALPDSYEALFHEMGQSAFLVAFDPKARATAELRAERLERAIGVVYRPETERFSHYFQAHLPQQFDAVLHIDRTNALRPLEPHTEPHPEEVPETFPSGV